MGSSGWARPLFWLGPALARLRVGVAAMRCRTFALPPGSVPVALSWTSLRRGGVSAAVAALFLAAVAALCLAAVAPGNAREHRAGLRGARSSQRLDGCEVP